MTKAVMLLTAYAFCCGAALTIWLLAGGLLPLVAASIFAIGAGANYWVYGCYQERGFE